MHLFFPENSSLPPSNLSIPSPIIKITMFYRLAALIYLQTYLVHTFPLNAKEKTSYNISDQADIGNVEEIRTIVQDIESRDQFVERMMQIVSTGSSSGRVVMLACKKLCAKQRNQASINF